MRISRLFIDQPLQPGQTLDLPDDSAHYLRTVLRLKKDQDLILFNGQGNEFNAKLILVSRKTVTVKILTENTPEKESPLTISLGLGISRGDRMDWAIQKAVELGVNSLTPLMTNHCVIKLSPEKQQSRIKHWQGIIQHACEQCGRVYLPQLNAITSLADWVLKQQHLKIFLDPYATHSLSQLQPENSSVTLLSGPEGGFSEQERQLAIQAGFTPVKLGRRILRTETAVLASISAIQTLWGDF